MLIGGVEALGPLSGQLAMAGPFWDVAGSLNDSLGYLGFAIVGIFVLCWAASTIIYRWYGYDRLDTSRPG